MISPSTRLYVGLPYIFGAIQEIEGPHMEPDMAADLRGRGPDKGSKVKEHERCVVHVGYH